MLSEKSAHGAPRLRSNYKYELLALAAILLGFLTLSVRFAAKQNLWVDEATQLSGLTLSPGDNLRWLIGLLKHPFVAPPDRTPPLSYWVGYIWQALFGSRTITMRYLSILETGSSIALVWLIGRRFLSRRAALCAALLMASSPNVIVESVEIRAYALFLLLSAWLVYTYLVAITASPERRNSSYLLFTVPAILVSFTHFFGVMIGVGGFLAIAAQGLCHAPTPKPSRQVFEGLTKPTVLYCAALALLSPFIVHAFTISHSRPNVGSGSAVTFRGGYAHDLAQLVYRLFAHQTMLGIPGLDIIVVLVGYGLLTIALGNRSQAVRALATYLAVSFILIATGGLLTSGFDVFSPSYNVWALPVVCLMAASTLDEPSTFKRRAASAGLLILFAAFTYGSLTLATHGQRYAHTRSHELRVLIDQYGPSQTSLAYLNDSGLTQFAVAYDFNNRIPQYLDEKGHLDRLDYSPTDAVDWSTVPGRVLIVAATKNLSARLLETEIATHGADSKVDGAIWGLFKSSENLRRECWRLLNRQRYLAQSALWIELFQRRRECRARTLTRSPG